MPNRHAIIVPAAPTSSTGSMRVRDRHRQLARYVLAITAGDSSVVILTPADVKDEGIFAARVTRAYEELIFQAEEMHHRFWSGRVLRIHAAERVPGLWDVELICEGPDNGSEYWDLTTGQVIHLASQLDARIERVT